MNADPRDDDVNERTVSRPLHWLGAGAFLCLAGALIAGASQVAGSTRGPVHVWAADRDAHRVVGLDRGLFVVREIAIGWPLAVESRADGGLWVLRSGNGTASFGMRLDAIEPDGTVANETYLEPCAAMALAAGRDALVVEKAPAAGQRDRAWRVEPDGSARVLLEDRDLAAIVHAPSTVVPSSVILGALDGRILRVDDSGNRVVLAQTVLPGAWGDLAAGPYAGSAFALDVSPARVLAFLGPDLGARWTVAVGFDARHLGAVAGEERVWVADASGARIRRYGPGGKLELDRTLAQIALDRPLALPDGGALFAAPGAILRVDSAGRPMPGQGGFTWLGDLALAR